MRHGRIYHNIVNGYKVKEEPVSMNERTGGVSSIRLWKSVDYMVKVVNCQAKQCDNKCFYSIFIKKN